MHMYNVALRSMAALAFVGMVGCGGSDSRSGVSNQNTRSLIGTWESDINQIVDQCLETWAFDEAYSVSSGAAGVPIEIGVGSFVFDETVISGERHSLIFTETSDRNTNLCDSSPYEDGLAGEIEATLYIEFNTADQIDAFTAATGGVSLGTFDRK